MSGVTLPGFGLGGETGHRFECSRAGCRETAEWALVWRNPKIHAADRRKTWLACAAHRAVLHDFLAARDFPLEVRSVGELDD
ncbi:MAG: hypothetical protein WDA07_04375 [Leucobacter sp.]